MMDDDDDDGSIAPDPSAGRAETQELLYLDGGRGKYLPGLHSTLHFSSKRRPSSSHLRNPQSTIRPTICFSSDIANVLELVIQRVPSPDYHRHLPPDWYFVSAE